MVVVLCCLCKGLKSFTAESVRFVMSSLKIAFKLPGLHILSSLLEHLHLSNGCFKWLGSTIFTPVCNVIISQRPCNEPTKVFRFECFSDATVVYSYSNLCIKDV